MSNSTDIIVVGAGMAGLVAAAQAQELGARVLLLEKGDAPGGSLALSGGTLWCARTYADLRRLVPRGDPELGQALVADFMDGVRWLEQLGAKLTRLPSEEHRYVFWMEPSPRVFVQCMVERLTARGAILLTRAAGWQLRVDAHGAVAELIARTADGLRSFDAPAVILATGGFQANPEMRARYFGQWSDRLILRSNPHSTGDGYQMGIAVGASPSRAMSSFYGHLLPAPPAVVPVTDFIAYTMYHSEQAVLVNARGERFTDESLGDEMNSQMTARQSEALAYLIYDDDVYRRYAVRETTAGASDTFYGSREIGALTATASSIEALAEAMAGWGVHRAGVVETIRGYNAAVAESNAAQLRIPRRAKANPVITPPFYALAVTPGITFTLGGLRINADAQALDHSGHPIAGLYVAGADSGGIHNEQYGGGLCLGLVFGRRAARHALSALVR